MFFRKFGKIKKSQKAGPATHQRCIEHPFYGSNQNIQTPQMKSFKSKRGSERLSASGEGNQFLLQISCADLSI
jgi:hypothetical protein